MVNTKTYFFVDNCPVLLYNGDDKMGAFQLESSYENNLYEDFINVLSEVILEIIQAENNETNNLVA